jgi:3-methyl-2-oxobutanoate hydroxymethyltransferase
MSVTHLQEAPVPGAASTSESKIAFPVLQHKKLIREPITALTAYDYPTARLADEAGIDLILVGDSLGMVVLGYDSTLPVTLDEMLHHTRAARRGTRRALLVADLPFGSYEADVTEGVHNAFRLVKEGGAEAVKIEGRRVDLTRRLSEAEIPVVGHLGLTPQAEALLADALALEAAGAAAVVLEGVPREVAERVTAALQIPAIGIGAGPGCDGQILVMHDLIGLGFAPLAKFARRYADVGALVREAIAEFAHDVRAGSFPADRESYHLDAETSAAFSALTGTEDDR